MLQQPPRGLAYRRQLKQRSRLQKAALLGRCHQVEALPEVFDIAPHHPFAARVTPCLNLQKEVCRSMATFEPPPVQVRHKRIKATAALRTRPVRNALPQVSHYATTAHAEFTCDPTLGETSPLQA